MKIALDKETVRYSIKEWVLQFVANRIERLAPSVVWPIARDRTTYDTEYLQDWVKIRDNVEHRELSSARQITDTIEMMSVVFMEIHDAGLIPVENSHLAEAMRLQMCCLYNPRAQELAHRLAPLMPKRPDENIAFHRVVKGDTLGGIAGTYGSSVKKIKEVNGLTSNALRLKQVLKVPLRGPCTSCPVPPLLVVPPRRVPPPPATRSLETPNFTAQR
jgi:LysM repeat protein